tara:strand:+ start:273 stop:764 length:492 start_codon:yes stop_codon:yes gene_type:complete
MITSERLHELFRYDDGQLIRKVTVATNAKAGDMAGTLGGTGYVQVKVDKVQYKLHRLIYKMHYGTEPTVVDHINGVPTDNRIENLRAATTAQNAQNSRLASDNSSGVKGVSWNNAMTRWVASVCLEGTRTHLGYFDTLEEATLVIKGARLSLHKEFTNHGEEL